MAVRQISGCSNIIDILNGFGHCVSHSSTLRHDTALAKIDINTEKFVPKEILLKKQRSGEETKVSTHITNDITIQREREDDLIPNPNVSKSQSKSLCTHPCEILPYAVGKKQSTSLRSIFCSLDLEEKVYITVQEFAEKM